MGHNSIMQMNQPLRIYRLKTTEEPFSISITLPRPVITHNPSHYIRYFFILWGPSLLGGSCESCIFSTGCKMRTTRRGKSFLKKFARFRKLIKIQSQDHGSLFKLRSLLSRRTITPEIYKQHSALHNIYFFTPDYTNLRGNKWQYKKKNCMNITELDKSNSTN